MRRGYAISHRATLLEKEATEMARVNQRSWRIPGRRAKRKAWGFSLVYKGKQERHYRAEWTKEEAEKALAERLLKIETKPAPRPGMTLAQAAERYLEGKARKRTLKKDERILEQLKATFGADTPLTDLTAGRISEYKAQRLAAKVGKPGTE